MFTQNCLKITDVERILKFGFKLYQPDGKFGFDNRLRFSVDKVRKQTFKKLIKKKGKRKLISYHNKLNILYYKRKFKSKLYLFF